MSNVIRQMKVDRAETAKAAAINAVKSATPPAAPATSPAPATAASTSNQGALQNFAGQTPSAPSPFVGGRPQSSAGSERIIK